MKDRLHLTIAYEGTSFRGWQSQKSQDGIQDHIEQALEKICGRPVRLHGAGRTDAGVHARAQVAHVDVEKTLDPRRWTLALNDYLPPAIRILRTRTVTENFHARFSARGKEYRYEVHTGQVLPPHLVRTVWHHPWPIDRELLCAAASIFVGTHDFSAFSANRGAPVTDPHRTIRKLHPSFQGPLIRLTYVGDGFLYKMVRMLTGAIFRVAAGKESLARLRQQLAHPENSRSQHVAPAQGLTLVRVIY